MAIFENSVRSPSIAAGATYNIIFTTGRSQAVFLARTVAFSGLALEANVYEAPTGVTGGSVMPSYTSDLYFGEVAQGVMTGGATVTGTGTKRAATTYYRGSTGNGNSVIGTYSAAGGARRLKNGTTYLLQFVNTDTNPQTVDVYFRWYEGADPTPGG